MSQQPCTGWTSQTYAHASTTPPDNRALEQSHSAQHPYAQSVAKNSHPVYKTSDPALIIAELSAPLPAAPPTTTPEKQFTDDEQLARKLSGPDQQMVEDEELAKQLQLLEVQKVGGTTYSNVTQQQPPVSTALPGPPWTPLPVQKSTSYPSRPHSRSIPSESLSGRDFAQQQARQSMRSHSQSLSGAPSSRELLGSPPQTQPRYSPPPEVSPAITELSPTALSKLREVVAGNVTQIAHMPLNAVSMAAYLEEHRLVPYPPQWRLDPTVKMYHAETSLTARADWLEAPQSAAWYSHRRSENPSNLSPAAYTFTFKRTGGSYRDPRFSWIMQANDAVSAAGKQNPVWAYELRLDLKSGVRKSEMLNAGGKTKILTSYVHASNCDSLRFVGNDGKAYLWVSQMPLSSVHGSRYDTIRHALFVANGSQQDPLHGDIVADHTYWDGFDGDTRVHQGINCSECQTTPIAGQRWNCKTCEDHDICGICHASGAQKSVKPACQLALTCLPDETLHIRSPKVDHALVIASLQILKDWQRHELRRQKTQDPKGFKQSEDTARQHDLGRLSYWRGSDILRLGPPQRIRSRMDTAEDMQNPNGLGGGLGNLADAGLAMAGQGQRGGYGGQYGGQYGGHHGGHYGYAGDGGGGGGDGGGGGG